ncbi:unnamed protein product [Miscanthus lutarioriparius]|uniref:Uncharacterized protein n=1 Tax=Miscanthus lutarioriparius TaxID=422564 RepID=A0A811NWL5_9POAL|nr:unnamed protein product [Miscanthus lutarioriparius]
MKGLWLSSLDLEQATPEATSQHSTYTAPTMLPRLIFSTWPGSRNPWPRPWWLSTPLLAAIDNDGRMEINWNGEGALFVVARANLTVDDIKELKPSPELRRLVVPCVEPASVVLAVQVTFLKCGGVALGTAIHHVSMDALSAFHFIQTWSAFAKHGNGAVVELPCHDRTLLCPRSPPTVHPDALLTFCPKVIFSDPLGPVVVKVFTISRDQVASLKHHCSGTSTFCAVSALLWQCACIARRLPLDSKARLTFPANVRRKVRPPLPDLYFGNALFKLGVTGAVRDIATEALGSVASRIKGAVDRMDDELVRSAIDYFEKAEIDTTRPLRGTLPQTHLQIVSWLGMPAYDADFGWGKPQVMSRAESIRGGVVFIMNNEGKGTADDGGVRVLVCLEAANMMELERLLYAKL